MRTFSASRGTMWPRPWSNMVDFDGSHTLYKATAPLRKASLQPKMWKVGMSMTVPTWSASWGTTRSLPSNLMGGEPEMKMANWGTC
jgi:hypothetical protein